MAGMPETGQRYLFIDLLRFAAAFLMIQGHVFDALLSTQIKSHSLFYIHDFFHGFIAPAFLFASGVAYGASTMKRWAEHTTWGKRGRRRMHRSNPRRRSSGGPGSGGTVASALMRP